MFGVVQGVEHEELFTLEEERNSLVEAGTSTNKASAVSGFAPPGDIHRVRNGGDDTAILIHVYGTDVSRIGSSVRRYYHQPVRPAGSSGRKRPAWSIFTTERLHADPLALAYADELAVLHADERVMATLGGAAATADESREWLERNLGHADEPGHGVFVFRDRATGSFVGRGAIRSIEIGGREEVEIGYALAAEMCWCEFMNVRRY